MWRVQSAECFRTSFCQMGSNQNCAARSDMLRALVICQQRRSGVDCSSFLSVFSRRTGKPTGKFAPPNVTKEMRERSAACPGNVASRPWRVFMSVVGTLGLLSALVLAAARVLMRVGCFLFVAYLLMFSVSLVLTTVMPEPTPVPARKAVVKATRTPHPVSYTHLRSPRD